MRKYKKKRDKGGDFIKRQKKDYSGLTTLVNSRVNGLFVRRPNAHGSMGRNASSDKPKNSSGPIGKGKEIVTPIPSSLPRHCANDPPKQKGAASNFAHVSKLQPDPGEEISKDDHGTHFMQEDFPSP